MLRTFQLSFAILALLFAAAPAGAEAPLERTLRLDPQPGNPRNSEGDFIALADGRILLVYTHFDGGADDSAQSHLAGRFTSDEGVTWTDKDVTILANEGEQNTMSVSLVRLADDRIALFYLRKNSNQDCRPWVRFSEDEAKTWSEPIACVPESAIGYYVLNNDRAIQLDSGRLVLPLALHRDHRSAKWTPRAVMLCYLSDDGGRTWRASATELGRGKQATPHPIVQEPGVVELAQGRLMMFCRTDAGSQFVSFSEDGGDHWSPLEPSAIQSPLSTASIERIPTTGDLLLVWNDHSQIDANLQGKRTPLSVSISRDQGQTWGAAKHIETNPHGWYCYTAMEFVEGHVLLAYCAGDRRHNNGLAALQVARLPLKWLYGE